MGGILAVFGNPDHVARQRCCAAMVDRSPYRGALAALHDLGGVTLSVQTGTPASVTANSRWAVAVHGVVTDWGSHGLAQGAKATAAMGILTLLDQLPVDDLFAGLSGQFSCVVHDRQRNLVHALRDIGGTKPLYYGAQDRCVVIASEARQVLAGLGRARRLNESTMAQLAGFASRALTPDQTLFDGIQRVLPAARVCWRQDGSLSGTADYWAPDLSPPAGADSAVVAEQVRRAVCDAVERTLPETPYAVSLSGGLDSSAIWACAKHQERVAGVSGDRRFATSLVFPGMACDESEAIQSNLTADDHWLPVDASGCRLSDELDDLIAGTDLMHGGLTVAYQPYFAQLAAHGVDTEISGHGADDLFFEGYGYLPDMLWRGEFGAWWDHLRHATFGGLQLRSPLASLRWLAQATVPPGSSMRAALRRIGKSPRASSLLADRWLHLEDAQEVRTTATRQGVAATMQGRAATWQALRHGFTVDAQEMYYAQHGVDWRFPFLDGQVIRAMLRLDNRQLNPGPEYKSLQRRSFSDLLPHRIVTAPVAYYGDFYQADDAWRHDAVPFGSWQLFERGFLDAGRVATWLDQGGAGAAQEMASWYYPLERMLRRFDP